jgi:hypothetical protein
VDCRSPEGAQARVEDHPDELGLDVLQDLLAGVAAGAEPPLELRGLATKDGDEARLSLAQDVGD